MVAQKNPGALHSGPGVYVYVNLVRVSLCRVLAQGGYPSFE